MVRAMDEDAGRQIPLVWVGLDDAPIHLANMFICQTVARDQFVLSIGQGVPPPLLGSPDEIREQVNHLTHVPIRPLARLSLTEETLQQLLSILQENLGMYQSAIEDEVQ